MKPRVRVRYSVCFLSDLMLKCLGWNLGLGLGTVCGLR